MVEKDDLIDRVSQFYRQAGASLTGPIPRWNPDRPSRILPTFSRRAQVVTAAALVVFAIGLNIVFSNLRHQAAANKPTISPSPSAIQSRPVAHSNLNVSGAMTAASRPDRDSTCGYRAANSRLLFGSDPMGAGSEVVRVGFEISLTANRVGTYDAIYPLDQYGRTALDAVVSSSENSGAGSFWRAVSGRVIVSRTEHLGESGAYGFASGTLEGDLVNQISGGSPIHVSGTWSCVINPEANGP
jgi:hypothetical protein